MADNTDINENDSGNYYASYEMEIAQLGKVVGTFSGPDKGYVEERTADFFENKVPSFLASGSLRESTEQLPLFVEDVEDLPLFATQDNSKDIDELFVEDKEIQDSSTPSRDIVELFLNAGEPSGQKEIVLLSAYHRQKYVGIDSLTLEDFEEALQELARAGIDTPKNIKSTVRNVVDRTKLLYNPERGKFALTIQGERFVEDLLKSNEEKSND